MKLSLDTNAYSRLATHQAGILSCVNEAETIYLSNIMLGELFAGFYLGKRERENRLELAAFLDLPDVSAIPVDAAIADRYGFLVKTLRSQGTPIPTNDIWIAATAFETGSRLVTYDTHFKHIPGLIIIAP